MRSLSHLLLHFGIFLQLASSCGSLSILPPKLEHRRHARRHSFGRGHNRRHHIKSLTFLSFAKPLDYDDVSNDEEKGENATKILLEKQDMIQTFPLNESMSETNCDTEINSLHNNTTATLSLRTFIRDIQNRYSSVMRTAIISFFAGALFPLLFFIILFNHSYKDSSSSVPQNSGISRSFSSVQSANGASIDKNAEKQKSVALYRSILEQLDRNYVEEINPLELFEISTRAMLSTLDPYSEYISPQDMENRQNLVGIGAFVMKGGIYDDESQSSKVIPLIPSAVALPNQLMDSQSNQSHDGFRVILSLEGYAFDAGIRVGDEIIAIDGYSVAGDSSANTLEQVRELLVGVPGSKVKVSFKRPGVDGVQTVEIERKPVQFPNVRYAGLLDKDIGYVQLRQFGIDAGESMKHAIQGLLDEVSRESSDSASTSQSNLKVCDIFVSTHFALTRHCDSPDSLLYHLSLFRLKLHFQ